ncbi:MAG: carboxypeptidase-like regulatory domain-containing protein [Bacteroidota bacterium]
MPRSLRHVSIPSPCAEDWQRMTPAGPTARFCDRCAHAVTDFSTLTPDEIAAVLTEREGRVCGRFRPAQLDRLNRALQPSPTRTWQTAAAVLVSATLAASPTVQAQEGPRPAAVIPYDVLSLPQREAEPQPASLALEGRVVEVVQGVEHPLSGANVWVDGSGYGVVADANGRFRLNLDGVDGDLADMQVAFSFVGYGVETIPAVSLLGTDVRVCLSVEALMGEVVVVKEPALHRRAWKWLRGLF